MAGDRAAPLLRRWRDSGLVSGGLRHSIPLFEMELSMRLLMRRDRAVGYPNSTAIPFLCRFAPRIYARPSAAGDDRRLAGAVSEHRYRRNPGRSRQSARPREFCHDAARFRFGDVRLAMTGSDSLRRADSREVELGIRIAANVPARSLTHRWAPPYLEAAVAP